MQLQSPYRTSILFQASWLQEMEEHAAPLAPRSYLRLRKMSWSFLESLNFYSAQKPTLFSSRSFLFFFFFEVFAAVWDIEQDDVLAATLRHYVQYLRSGSAAANLGLRRGLKRATYYDFFGDASRSSSKLDQVIYQRYRDAKTANYDLIDGAGGEMTDRNNVPLREHLRAQAQAFAELHNIVL